MILCHGRNAQGPATRARHAVAIGALAMLITTDAAGQGLRPPWALDGSHAPQIVPTRFGAECAGVIAPREETPEDSAYHSAVLMSLTIGDLAEMPGSMRGQTITIRVLINASGGVDSVEFDGRVDRRYAANLRGTMMKARFHPAIYRGCAVKAWGWQMTETIGRRRLPPGDPALVEILGREWPVMSQAPWTEPTAPFVQEALPGNLPLCAKHRPALSYGELPDPAAAHGNGRVILRFVIDTAGVPVDSTVRIMQTSGPAFTAEVRRTFSSLRFYPAWCGSGPAAMDVQYTFVFVK